LAAGDIFQRAQRTSGHSLRAIAAILVFLLFTSLRSLNALSEPSGGAESPAAVLDSFQFSTHSFSNYFPTLLGNGYLSASIPWNGASASEATLTGLYDNLEQNSYVYQALIPSWNNIDYWDGLHWLDRLTAASIHLQGYLQTLDMRRGLLTTHFDWVDVDHVTRIKIEEFLSRRNPHLGVIRIHLTPDYGVRVGPVTFSFPLGGKTGPPFTWEGAELPGAIPIRSVRADSDLQGFVAECETRDGKIHVAEAVRVGLPHNLPPIHQVNLGFSPNLAEPALNIKFIVHKGHL
jgi:Glycosyl hydrolase family 65, N-terminal domain